MRSPRRLANELGLPGFAAFQLLVGGSVVAALVHSLFAIELLRACVAATLSQSEAPDLLGFHVATLLAGYAISAALGLIGLARRGLLHCAWALLLTPLYWMLLSLAAWRALFQFMHDPYRWEKTQHGLARTSRLEQFQQTWQPTRRPTPRHRKSLARAAHRKIGLAARIHR